MQTDQPEHIIARCHNVFNTTAVSVPFSMSESNSSMTSLNLDFLETIETGLKRPNIVSNAGSATGTKASSMSFIILNQIMWDVVEVTYMSSEIQPRMFHHITSLVMSHSTLVYKYTFVKRIIYLYTGLYLLL